MRCPRVGVYLALLGAIGCGWFAPAASAQSQPNLPTEQAMPVQPALPAIVDTPPQAVNYGDSVAYPATPAASYSPYAATSNPAAAENAVAPAAHPALASPYDNVSPTGVAQPSNMAGTGFLANDLTASVVPNDPSVVPGSHTIDTNDYVERVLTGEEPWTWQLLPTGLMYKTYLAGPCEPRMGSRWSRVGNEGWMWDATLGARLGLFRYGTDNDLWSQGWQFDVEGAAFPRLDNRGDVLGNDYIFGVPLTTRQGPWEWKLGYRHYCSHIGDEYLLKTPGFPRINYVRDSMLMGVAYYLTPSLRFYYEAGWGFWCDGGAKPWEHQFGADFSPPGPTTNWGAPFFAINSHLTQENDYSGNFTVQTGWQWRGRTGHLFRIGAHYFNGLSEQRQFYNQWEEQIGFGAWYDF